MQGLWGASRDTDPGGQGINNESRAERETQGDEEKGNLCLKDADTIVSDSEI